MSHLPMAAAVAYHPDALVYSTSKVDVRPRCLNLGPAAVVCVIHSRAQALCHQRAASARAEEQPRCLPLARAHDHPLHRDLRGLKPRELLGAHTQAATQEATVATAPLPRRRGRRFLATHVLAIPIVYTSDTTVVAPATSVDSVNGKNVRMEAFWASIRPCSLQGAPP